MALKDNPHIRDQEHIDCGARERGSHRPALAENGSKSQVHGVLVSAIVRVGGAAEGPSIPEGPRSSVFFSYNFPGLSG